jgi:hypothetical protein
MGDAGPAEVDVAEVHRDSGVVEERAVDLGQDELLRKVFRPDPDGFVLREASSASAKQG